MIEYGTDYTDERGEPFESDGRWLDLEARLIGSDDLDDLPVPRALIEDVLYLDSVAWMQGRPGSYKSFVAQDMAHAASLGLPWQGFPTANADEGVFVLYVIAEGTSGLRQRVRAWESVAGHSTLVSFLPMALQATNERDWDALIQLAKGVPYSFIVLDTQARLTVGMEENSARDMGIWVRQLERLREATGACVLVVHHQGRTGEHMRGSTAMEGAATTVLQVTKDEDVASLRCLKQKDAPEFDEIRLRLVPTLDSATLMLSDGRRTGSATTIAARWLAEWSEMHGGDFVSVSVLTKSGVVSETTFHRSKLALITEGSVERKGEGNSVRYRLLWRPPGDSHTPTLRVVGVGGSQSGSHGTPTGAWESDEDES